jgi:hypothetical protein
LTKSQKQNMINLPSQADFSITLKCVTLLIPLPHQAR